MVNAHTVIIVESESNSEEEIKQAINVLIQSVQAKKGNVRIAYQGNRADIIKTIDNLLDMERLSNTSKK
jgi:hypothetical protein